MNQSMPGQQTAVCVHSILAGMHTPGLLSRRDAGREMAGRKRLSKRVRFEVFKRDSFKCQYCGKSAPDVVLHVDHIQPVSKGGDADLLNLITSCIDCNLGKSDKHLADDSAISKQREQLEQLNLRREQLTMMLNWRDSLKAIDSEKLSAIEDAWSEAVPGWHLNENGLSTARKFLSKFALEVVLSAIDTAAGNYLKFDSEHKPTQESVELAWAKVGGIVKLSLLDESERELYYLRGILKNRVSYIVSWECINLLKEAKALGYSVDDLRQLIFQARSWTQWAGWMDEWIELARKGNTA